MLPEKWSDLLAAPVFIISMDEKRYRVCEGRARAAGFANITRANGVDRNSEQAIQDAWARHQFLPQHKMIGPHPSAVMLAHLDLWKHIIDKEIDYAVVIEDDPLFHTEWNNLAERYYNSTPKTADMVYMGHHCGNVFPDMYIAQVPVYCTNAYIVTQVGVIKLYNMITRYPYEDFGVIDMMLVRLQTDIVMGKGNPYGLSWYAWNTQMFPDPKNDPYKNSASLLKDKGLVFQQWPYFELDHEK